MVELIDASHSPYIINVIYAFLFGFENILSISDNQEEATTDEDASEEGVDLNETGMGYFRSVGKIKRKYYRVREARESISLLPSDAFEDKKIVTNQISHRI